MFLAQVSRRKDFEEQERDYFFFEMRSFWPECLCAALEASVRRAVEARTCFEPIATVVHFYFFVFRIQPTGTCPKKHTRLVQLSGHSHSRHTC